MNKLGGDKVCRLVGICGNTPAAELLLECVWNTCEALPFHVLITRLVIAIKNLFLNYLQCLNWSANTGSTDSFNIIVID